jgi:hypothetical protein
MCAKPNKYISKKEIHKSFLDVTMSCLYTVFVFSVEEFLFHCLSYLFHSYVAQICSVDRKGVCPVNCGHLCILKLFIPFKWKW